MVEAVVDLTQRQICSGPATRSPIPEEAAKKSMDNLEAVIEGLEHLQSVFEQP